MDKMRVCLLNDSFPPVIDGVANVVMNYAKIMQKQGMADVLVGTPRYPEGYYEGYPYKVVPYHSFDTTKIVKGYRAGNPFALAEMQEMVDFAPNIIHTHCPVASSLVARGLRDRTLAPVVFTYHTKFNEDIERAVKNEFIQNEAIKVIVSNIEACDEVWVVSSGAGENLKSLGFEGDYTVMENGVDFAKGRVPEEKVSEAIRGYDIPDGVPLFLFVGRIISYKGIPIIIDACRKLADDGQDFRLVIVGKGPDEEEMKARARQAGLLDNPDPGHVGKCFFTGPIYDRDVLRAWNTRADLFLFPSTYDTNGIVVREAAATATASLLVRGSCAAEGITDGRNGFLIEQNAQSMYEMLKKLCANPDCMASVGQNAMDEIYISWEDSVKKAYARYERILEFRRRGSFKVKVNPVAEFMNSVTEELSEDIRKIFDKPTMYYDTMLDNVGTFTQDVKEEFKKLWNHWKEL
ncbi:MAG: glycosyltransferase [Lachnospiraceae bacterium]|nr:glycosyltransferase [Lachnospiraceae bacterium]